MGRIGWQILNFLILDPGVIERVTDIWDLGLTFYFFSRCISVQCGGKNTIQIKICGIYIAASLAINAGMAAFWIKIVGDKIDFNAYGAEMCALPITIPTDSKSTHFWMEVSIFILPSILFIVSMFDVICALHKLKTFHSFELGDFSV